MTIKSFLEVIKENLAKLSPNSNIGSYVFKGLNNTVAFGSPGGNWDPTEFPSFEFQRGNKTYLLRLIPEQDKIIIEAVHLNNMLINYKINAQNFTSSNERIKLVENYKMTVQRPRSYDEVKSAIISSGMTNDIILEEDINNLNLGRIIDSLFTWADYREKAKEKIRGKQNNQQETYIQDELNQPKSNIFKEQKPINQILFGPPGTGKTFNTLNKALAIINPSFDLEQSRERIKEEYDRLIKDEQIVFTTFHQSMSYEDFIEGIKPIEPKEEGQQVNYKIIDGIFKKACAIAAYNCYKLFNKSQTQPNTYSFDDLYSAFIESIQEQIDNKNPPVYKTLRGRDVEVKEINRNDSIIARAKNTISKSSAPLTKENLQKLYDRFKTIEEIEDLKQVQETVQVTPRITEFYAIFSGLKQFETNYKPDEQMIIESNEIEALDIEGIQKKFNEGVYRESIKNFGKKAEPVVVIIDEINRGNVSQIFGELITLVEKDKRLGNNESLEVTLTYSKKIFGVPSNLYIVGTMNTADRSVEALDTALRRRFSFQEMPPKYDLSELKYNIFDYKAFEILGTVNSRIEKLLDKDHLIGHSYFIFKDDDGKDIKDEKMLIEKVRESFYENIIPLLQEYFYGDYGKIGMVLGQGFVRKKDLDNSFADFDPESTSDFDDRDVFEILNYRNNNQSKIIRIDNKDVEMSFEKAIKLLMKLNIEK